MRFGCIIVSQILKLWKSRKRIVAQGLIGWTRSLIRPEFNLDIEAPPTLEVEAFFKLLKAS